MGYRNCGSTNFWLATETKEKSPTRPGPSGRTLATINELQDQLNQFRVEYGNDRPHRSLSGARPRAAYHARFKATPTALTTRTKESTATSSTSPKKPPLRCNG
jgi:hypothetical protein